MLFNSFRYWIFFFIVAALFYSVPFRVGKVLLATGKLRILHVVGLAIYRAHPDFHGRGLLPGNLAGDCNRPP